MASQNNGKTKWPLYQSTLKAPVKFAGYGVHSAKQSELQMLPAPANTGIVFLRKDEKGSIITLSALSKEISATGLATVLGHGKVRAEMIEHIMAALAAFQIDNVFIELTSNEMPILDGGSYSYAKAFSKIGKVQQQEKRPYIVIEKPVRVENAHGFAEFIPYDGCRFDVSIAFANPLIGESNFIFDLNEEDFTNKLSKARTFGFVKDIETLWAANMALGSSLDNSIVIGVDGKIVNAQGLFYEDEFARHKMLDTIGDTALLGAPFIGLCRSYKGGHGLNAILVKELLAKPTAYRSVFADELG